MTNDRLDVPMSDAAVPSPVPIPPPEPPATGEDLTSQAPPVPLIPLQPEGDDRYSQVRLKNEGGRLLLTLPTETEFNGSWIELAQQLQLRLNGGDRFWQPHNSVHLIARDRLLDTRQLQAIADALGEVQLKLKRVYTSRRQTAVAAATAGYSVEQVSTVAHLTQANGENAQPLAEPLYLQTTVRSGVEIRHPGTVVILGDLNPGSSAIAQGDILVWGRLRGIAHAGASGNAECIIMALQMEPTQLRIADKLARAPQKPLAQYYPEVAYATADGIRIAKATEFAKIRPSSAIADRSGTTSDNPE